MHTNPSRKRSFSRTLFKPKKFENVDFVFSCGRKTFRKRRFPKTITSRWSCDFPDRVSITTVFVDTRLWKTNTRGNVSKISVNPTCYRHVGSKSAYRSPLAWRREGQKVRLVSVICGFRSDLSTTRKTGGNFGNVSAGVLFSKVAYQPSWETRPGAVSGGGEKSKRARKKFGRRK